MRITMIGVITARIVTVFGFMKDQTHEQHLGERALRVRLISPEYRGTGFSTRQMKEAPLKALYICPNTASVPYHRRLAVFLGREDLEIVSGESALDMSRSYAGRRFTGVVLDHACEPSEREWDVLSLLEDRIDA